MKILLNNFQDDEDFVLQEEVVPADLDLDIGVMHFPENLKLRAQAWKSRDDLTVQVHVEGRRNFTCSLCLEEFDNLFEKDFALHYDIRGLNSVTIDSDVRDELILEHPIRVLCRADCRGLCPRCGTNLNKRQCDCKAEGNK